MSKSDCNDGDLVSFTLKKVNGKSKVDHICFDSKKYIGIIKFYNKDKGYGYIICNDENYIKFYSSEMILILHNDLDNCECHAGDLISFNVKSVCLESSQNTNIKYIQKAINICLNSKKYQE